MKDLAALLPHIGLAKGLGTFRLVLRRLGVTRKEGCASRENISQFLHFKKLRDAIKEKYLVTTDFYNKY